MRPHIRHAPDASRHPRRARRAVLAGAVAALAVAAPAVAEPPPGFRSLAAFDDTTVLATVGGGCADPNAGVFAVSRDRGVTWTTEPASRCAPFPIIHGRVGEGMVVTIDGGNHLLRPDLTRTPLPAGPVRATTGTDAYLFASFGGPWMSRLSDDRSSWVACGPLPGADPGEPTDMILLAERLLVRGTAGGATAWFRSTDRCAGWAQIPSPAYPPDCPDPERWLESAHAQLIVGCIRGGGFLNSYRSPDEGRTWTPTARRQVAFAPPDRVVHLDRYAAPWDPATWPRPTAFADDPGVPDDQRAMIGWVNTRYRRPLGLPDLTWSRAMSQAAANHVAYWGLNGVGPGLDAHSEVPGSPGFTGARPGGRCEAAGYTGGCAEVAYPRVGALSDAVPSWLNTPYHGPPFLLDLQVGMAAREGVGSVANSGPGVFGGLAGTHSDGAAPVNTPHSMLKVWPAAGTTDVPLRWLGGEVPDPLRNYTGNRADVGPVLYVMAERGPVTLWLTGPDGDVPLLEPLGTEATTRMVLPVPVDTDARLHGVFAARVLAPATPYTLHVRDGEGRAADTTFTTAAGGAGPVDDLPSGDRPSAPVITRFTVTRRAFRAGGRLLTPARGRPVGTRLGLRVTVTGTLRVHVDRLAPGRRRGARCLTGLRTGRACVRSIRIGTVTVGRIGTSAHTAFTGAVGGRLLAPGGYRLTARVTGVNGRVSNARTVTVRVLR